LAGGEWRGGEGRTRGRERGEGRGRGNGEWRGKGEVAGGYALVVVGIDAPGCGIVVS